MRSVESVPLTATMTSNGAGSSCSTTARTERSIVP
jgi:hypothetical protein